MVRIHGFHPCDPGSSPGRGKVFYFFFFRVVSPKQKVILRRPGIKPGSRPWQGRILSLYYRRGRLPLSIPRLELGTSRVLGERHDQLDHTDERNESRLEYLGFDPSTSSLLRTHASDCANTPLRVLMEYLGFDPSTSCLRSTHASDCANTPMAFAGAAVKRRRVWGQKIKRLKLRHGESNPGHLRDRQRCYQLHHDG